VKFPNFPWHKQHADTLENQAEKTLHRLTYGGKTWEYCMEVT
jgi:hypothetical protein